MSKNLVIFGFGLVAFLFSGIQVAEGEVWIIENDFSAFVDSSGQYTVIGAIKNTEDVAVIPTITINIQDEKKIISESFEHVPILPSKEMPFKIKFPQVISKSPILLEPEISYVSTEKTSFNVEVIYDETLVKHEDGHLTGRIINNGESTVHNIKVFAVIHGVDEVLDVGQNIEMIEKLEPGEIQNFSMYPDPSIQSEINYYSCFAIGDSSIVTLNAKRNDEQYTIRIDSGHTISYPEFDEDGKNLSLDIVGSWPTANYANLEFPISSTTEKFDVYFNDEPIEFIQSIDEMRTWHVAFNLDPQTQGKLLITGFEEKEIGLDLQKDFEIPSDIEIIVFNSPLKQLQIGIEPESVVCKKGLELIIKYDGSPACVTLETAENLERRNWGIKL